MELLKKLFGKKKSNRTTIDWSDGRTVTFDELRECPYCPNCGNDLIKSDMIEGPYSNMLCPKCKATFVISPCGLNYVGAQSDESI